MILFMILYDFCTILYEPPGNLRAQVRRNCAHRRVDDAMFGWLKNAKLGEGVPGGGNGSIEHPTPAFGFRLSLNSFDSAMSVRRLGTRLVASVTDVNSHGAPKQMDLR